MRIKKIFVILIIALITLSGTAFGEIKTLYRTNTPTQIFTRINYETVIAFSVEVEYVSIGNTNAFKVEVDQKRDKLTIIPLLKGRETNMIVVTKSNEKYVFILIENSDNSTTYYNLVEMKSVPNVNYKDLILMANKKIIGIDPALKDIIKIYDIKENTYVDIPLSKTANQTIPAPQGLRLYVKRTVLVQNLDKTVFYLRLENVSREKVKLVFSKTKVNNHAINAIAFETNKDELDPDEFIDMYVFLEGASLDKSYTYQLMVNGNYLTAAIKNIPFDKQDFSVFVNDDGSGEYINFSIGGYWRN